MNTTHNPRWSSVAIGILGWLVLSANAVRAELPYQVDWSRQLGTSGNDASYDISADGLGSVYISGHTYGSLGRPNVGGHDDAFVSKYDASGNLQWTRQLGTSDGDTISHDVSADGLGNVYISGLTTGSLDGPARNLDAFVSKYDASGKLQWTRQLGTSDADAAAGVSADDLGNVYISGRTTGSLGGPHAGSDDAFVSKYDASGNLLWTQQLGTSDHDASFGVSANGLGSVYISGETTGSLGGPSAGRDDAFAVRLSPAVPEPSTFTLAALGLLGGLWLQRRRASSTRAC